MMTRDDKSAVILGLRKHHGLLAAFLEAANKVDHERMATGEMAKFVNATARQVPHVGTSAGSVLTLQRANLVTLVERTAEV